MLHHGIKVSKPGQNVLVSNDIDTVFSSKFSTLKLLYWGNITLTTNGAGNGQAVYNHNLNYAPAHYVFLKGTAQFTYLDAASYPNSFTPVTQVPCNWIPMPFNAYTSSTQLVINAVGALPNTTYTFRYYILVDRAVDYAGDAGISLVNGYGLKVSKAGYDVKTAKEYQMAYSQKYKSLQYYPENYKVQNLSLPEFAGNVFFNPRKAGTYVDIAHGLGYAPFFLAFADNFPFIGGVEGNVLVPTYSGHGSVSQTGYAAVEAFCDATRVRVSFYEESGVTQTGIDNGVYTGDIFPAATVTIRVIIFTENLNP